MSRADESLTQLPQSADYRHTIDEFWADYNSAMNNPAPDDDGGTTAYEIEALLDRATDLLDIVWEMYVRLKDESK